ncbi:MAG: AmmeMemoRadiSam system radical SAM enzyme [Candidatus Goldbacteria bacterium]|nr:AmmeMemoRadiSam system radical SAM enzyme [Candidatus Goldiibacteriota bacterium]
MKYYKKSTLFLSKENDNIICLACQRKCLIKNKASGACGVRINIDGQLYVPWGYFSSLNIDPIEKKPLYHFLPGSKTLSFGMYGCNFFCLYCQNWQISQIKNNEINLSKNFYKYKDITPVDFHKIMIENDIMIAVSTYNEPTVTIEWAYDIFSNLKMKNINFKTGFISNGYLSKEAFDFILPVLDFIKIDIKVFNYHKFNKLTGANFDLFLDSVKYITSKYIHVEFVNLIVEEFNDDEKDFNLMVDFILSISNEIPLHLTAFHPDYNMLDKKNTSPLVIEKLIDIARKKGLKYVYGGNYISSYSDTLCPSCGKVIIQRGYMSVIKNDVYINNSKGFCPYCKYEVYGVWC